METCSTYFEQLAVLSEITLNDLVVFSKEFFSNFHARILIQGNMIAETAKQIAAEFSKGFAMPRDPEPKVSHFLFY